MCRPAIHVATAFMLANLLCVAAFADDKSSSSSQVVAKEVDRRLMEDLQKAGVHVADRCNDEDFLRRASLDISGQLPTPQEIAAFRQDTAADKRVKLIDRLIDSNEFGLNWARYWRDVIYLRATEQRSRINQMEFETWMADQWNRGVGWNKTVSAMLTASGNVEENPETALIFAQGAIAEEVTAESCRIFLGIQLQCANCHDHPSDVWKREQFHQLAAYFPRIAERRMGDQKPPIYEIVSVNNDRGKQGDRMRENPEQFIAMFDRNKDHKLSKEEMIAGPAMMGGRMRAAMKKQMNDENKEMKDEMKDEMKNQANGGKPNAKMVDRLFEFGDVDKDGLLTADEIKKMPEPPANLKRGSTEHHMVDLQHPAEEGRVIDPKFFVDGSTLPHGQTDEQRRHAVAQAFTSPTNPWFARAIVNRIWAEMLSEGFYMPVDDLGPKRTARFPEVLALICKSFIESGYDPKWLVRTIANTEAYQRKIQSKPASENELPFASATPVPLRSDLIFTSLMQVFGVNEATMLSRNGKAKEMKDKAQAYRQNPRFMFDMLFAADPSIPKDDITGNIPQSLLLMNSKRFRAGMSASGESRLGKILKANDKNSDAIQELYLLVLAREPSAHEIEICSQYVSDVKARPEAFEDVMWSLINSSEFISRR